MSRFIVNLGHVLCHISGKEQTTHCFTLKTHPTGHVSKRQPSYKYVIAFQNLYRKIPYNNFMIC